MKTLKQIVADAERYQAIRESGEITVSQLGSGFALRMGAISEADKQRLDEYTLNLAQQMKGN